MTNMSQATFSILNTGPTLRDHSNDTRALTLALLSVGQLIIANPRLDPTFLLADEETVATCKLTSINRIKLENLMHRVFDPALRNLT